MSTKAPELLRELAYEIDSDTGTGVMIVAFNPQVGSRVIVYPGQHLDALILDGELALHNMKNNYLEATGNKLRSVK